MFWILMNIDIHIMLCVHTLVHNNIYSKVFINLGHNDYKKGRNWHGLHN